MKQTLHSEDGRYVLRIERRFAHPQRKVWRSITEPQHFRRWYPFSTGEMDLRVGGRLGFDDGEGSTYEAVVTELDPPRVFAFREVDDLLRIELRPDGDGCLMIFTHTFDDPAWATHTAAGWHRCLDAVAMLLDDRPVEWPENAAELREFYAKEFGPVPAELGRGHDMDESLGTLSTENGRPVLRFERRLAHPPRKVWRAVTDPAEMSRWFPATVRTELRVGAPMRFAFGDDDLDLGSKYADGEILELDPPKVYAFRWVDEDFRIELLDDEAGCLLVFTATLSGAGTVGDLPSVARTAPGWDGCLDALAAWLDGRPAPQPDQSWHLRRAERYVEAYGLGEGTVAETGDGWLLRFERDLIPAPDAVWSTLLADHDGEVADGAPPPLRATNGYVPAGLVTAVEPGRLLEYAWLRGDAPAGRVRIELRDQEPIGTRLVLTQTVPAALPDLRATALAAWQTHLELFFAALFGDVRCPWPAERTERLEREYADRLG